VVGGLDPRACNFGLTVGDRFGEEMVLPVPSHSVILNQQTTGPHRLTRFGVAELSGSATCTPPNARKLSNNVDLARHSPGAERDSAKLGEGLDERAPSDWLACRPWRRGKLWLRAEIRARKRASCLCGEPADGQLTAWGARVVFAAQPKPP
jgi:hypothetical protein